MKRSFADMARDFFAGEQEVKVSAVTPAAAPAPAPAADEGSPLAKRAFLGLMAAAVVAGAVLGGAAPAEARQSQDIGSRIERNIERQLERAPQQFQRDLLSGLRRGSSNNRISLHMGRDGVQIVDGAQRQAMKDALRARQELKREMDRELRDMKREQREMTRFQERLISRGGVPGPQMSGASGTGRSFDGGSYSFGQSRPRF